MAWVSGGRGSIAALMAGALAFLVACSDGGNNTDSDAASGASLAPDSIGGWTITFAETGGPTNTWSFPAEGNTATLTTDSNPVTAAFTYEVNPDGTTTIEFDVGGTDRYDMTWTSSTGGTFSESFDNTPGNDGSFVAQPPT